MSNIVEAEYQIVQERSLPVIASEILQIEENACRVAMDAAIRIGARLIEAKELAGHGKWAQWCEENLNYSQKKAERFMKIYEEYSDPESPYLKSTTLSKLSISKALSLLDIPKEEVESFAENHNIDELSVRELEAEIKALKASNEEAEEKVFKATNLAASLEKQIDELKATGADPGKIQKLEAEIEKLKEKEKKLKDDLAEAKRTKQAEVLKAISEKEIEITSKAKIEAASEIKKINAENEKLKKEAEELERKIKNSANENTLIFKLRADQLQESFKACALCIQTEPDEETKEKMKKALITVIDKLKGEI